MGLCINRRRFWLEFPKEALTAFVKGREMGVLFCMRVNTEYANEESAAWKSNPRQTAEDHHSPSERLVSPKGVVRGTDRTVSPGEAQTDLNIHKMSL